MNTLLGLPQDLQGQLISWLVTNYNALFIYALVSKTTYKMCNYYGSRNNYLRDLSCAHAAKHNHLEVLKWARETGAPWNENTCNYAARNGHLEILKWARENGCPWNEEACSNAVETGHFEVLKWAIVNGCPCKTDICY